MYCVQTFPRKMVFIMSANTNLTIVGIDIVKEVFQKYRGYQSTTEAINKFCQSQTLFDRDVSPS